MNQMIKSLALVLVMVMCIGMFTACAGDSAETTKPTTDPSKPATTAPVDPDNIVGVVTQISSTFMALDLCDKSVQGVPYKEQDPSALAGTGEIDYVYLNSSALFAHYTDGKLQSLKKADLSVGDIVVVTKTEKGIQQIVILNYKADVPATDPSTPSAPTEPTGSAN